MFFILLCFSLLFSHILLLYFVMFIYFSNTFRHSAQEEKGKGGENNGRDYQHRQKEDKSELYRRTSGFPFDFPLFLPKEITDTMRHIIGAGIPTSILSAPVAGYSSPITVIGCIAQCHTEILAAAREELL